MAGLHHGDGGAAVAQQRGQAGGGLLRIDGQIGAARLEDAQDADQHVDGALVDERHHCVGADAGGEELMGQAVGAALQLGEGEDFLAVLHRRRLGGGVGLALEGAVQGGGGDQRRSGGDGGSGGGGGAIGSEEARAAVAPRGQQRGLGGADRRERGEAAGRRGRGLAHQRGVAVDEQLQARRRERAGGSLHRQLERRGGAPRRQRQRERLARAARLAQREANAAAILIGRGRGQGRERGRRRLLVGEGEAAGDGQRVVEVLLAGGGLGEGGAHPRRRLGERQLAVQRGAHRQVLGERTDGAGERLEVAQLDAHPHAEGVARLGGQQRGQRGGPAGEQRAGGGAVVSSVEKAAQLGERERGGGAQRLGGSDGNSGGGGGSGDRLVERQRRRRQRHLGAPRLGGGLGEQLVLPLGEVGVLQRAVAGIGIGIGIGVRRRAGVGGGQLGHQHLERGDVAAQRRQLERELGAPRAGARAGGELRPQHRAALQRQRSAEGSGRSGLGDRGS